ncbi:MAG TPA: M3 family oligoendopeptidase, partial [Trueperaceae bacterium]|nr:M3 family oligoendopeptidase [Trueperaceae bacterium]
MPATTLPARSELDEAYTWDLSSLYATDQAYLDDLAAVPLAIDELSGYRGRLGSSATVLGDFFGRLWDTSLRLRRLANYSGLPVTVDQTDQAARQRAGRFQALAAQFEAATAFVAPELLDLGGARLNQLIASDARLSHLGRYVEQLEKRRPHIRSGEIESLLSATSDPLSAIEKAYNSLTNGEIPFAAVTHAGAEHEVARSTYPRLRMAADRELRRKAYESYTDGFLAFDDTITELYVGRVKQSVFLARQRGYADTVEEQLAPREVPRSVLDAVVDTFTANLGVWHRYWEARRRILGVERLEEHDVFARLTDGDFEVPYERAVDWIVAGMRPLGAEYVEPLQQGLRHDRWVDVYPNRGKRDGAFCSRVYGHQPQVMMSYQGDLESMSTLAHELGHAMHGVLLDAAQPLVYANYSMVMAETASNFNQALVRSHLLDEFTEPTQRLAVLEEAFYNFHRYFFIMPTLVRFELAVHQAVERGEGMTSARLNDIMLGLFQEGYGDALTADERTGVTWAQFGHLYVPFYTFQYAAGIAA